jgi:hypothetical protein
MAISGRDYLLGIVNQINKAVGELPDSIFIKNTGHPYFSGKVDGFIEEVAGVKCFIKDAVTVGTPQYIRYPMITTFDTTTYAQDTTGPAQW